MQAITFQVGGEMMKNWDLWHTLVVTGTDNSALLHNLFNTTPTTHSTSSSCPLFGAGTQGLQLLLGTFSGTISIVLMAKSPSSTHVFGHNRIEGIQGDHEMENFLCRYHLML